MRKLESGSRSGITMNRTSLVLIGAILITITTGITGRTIGNTATTQEETFDRNNASQFDPTALNHNQGLLNESESVQNVAEFLYNQTESMRNDSEAVRNVTGKFKNAFNNDAQSKLLRNVYKNVEHVSKEMQDVSSGVQTVSKELRDVFEKLQSVSEEIQNITKDVDNVSQEAPDAINKAVLGTVQSKNKQTFQNASKNQPGAPEMVQKVAGDVYNVSEVVPKVPEIVQKVPEVFHNVAEVVNNSPEKVYKVSEMLYNVPEEVHNVSEVVQNVPEHKYKAPGEVHNVPEIAQKEPEVFHNVAKVVNNSPEKFYKVSEMLYNVPDKEVHNVSEESRNVFDEVHNVDKFPVTIRNVSEVVHNVSEIVHNVSGLLHDNVLLVQNVSNLLDDLSNVHLPNAHHRLKHSTSIMFARSWHKNADADPVDCPKSSDDFPELFTHEQRQHGAVIFAFAIGIYCFTLLAIICDKYFLPCVERFCEVFAISEDVGAATFMSIATSAPELFVNIIGTFVTESDIGIGTIVGSSMFNTLGVASLGGLFATTPIIIDWCPLTRDVIIYIISILLLVGISWDGKIYWHEGLVLFIAYFVYFIFMFQNKRLYRIFCRCPYAQNDNTKHILESGDTSITGSTNTASDLSQMENEVPLPAPMATSDPLKPAEKTLFQKFLRYYCAPIKFMLFLTVPDPKKYRKLFPLTFIMCILWIGTNSYLVSWMITVIGSTFGLPDSVLGLTFLAAGGCLPEAISISIMSRRGEGKMGVSNALGANSMNILLSLGMPWFFKTISMGANQNAYIQIDSGAIEYTILALVAVALSLYLTLYFNKFALSRVSGGILLGMYTVWIVLAILSELVFFKPTLCAQ